MLEIRLRSDELARDKPSPVQARLLDVQWLTAHLESLGAVEISRRDYLELLDLALDVPPPWWG